MPTDPKVVDITVMNGGARRDVAVVVSYEPDSDSDGQPIIVHAEVELACARNIGEILNRHFPGYLPWWRIEASVKAGGVKIAMPALLGPNVVWFIRGTELDERQVVRAGGALLEMLRLDRARMRLDQVLEARKRATPAFARRFLKENS